MLLSHVESLLLSLARSIGCISPYAAMPFTSAEPMDRHRFWGIQLVWNVTLLPASKLQYLKDREALNVKMWHRLEMLCIPLLLGAK